MVDAENNIKPVRWPKGEVGAVEADRFNPSVHENEII